MGRSLALLLVAAIGATAWIHVFTREAGPAAANTCGSHAPFDFDTLETRDSATDYKLAISLAAEGKLVPSLISAAGETVDLRYQGVIPGNRLQRAGGGLSPNANLRIPPTIFYATAWIESTWANASSSVPWGGVGPVMRSFDCGFGIGQVTSGMANNTGTPTVKQTLIGTNFVYNLAESARIMADKWNQAPSVRPIAGQGDPTMLEDWYYAIWSYNGFAFINHPFHPDRNPLRAGTADSPIFHCYDSSAPSYVRNSSGVGVMFAFSHYTYPEKVYGCMRHPAQRNGQQLWQPVTFNMPDFDREEIARAFKAEHFLEGFSSGYRNMDFPTTFADNPETKDVNEELKPNRDIVPATLPGEAARFLGAPSLRFSGPAAATLEARPTGAIDSTTITATNTGTYVAPIRIRTSAPWLVVRNTGDPASRTLDGTVAVGAGTEVVITSSPLTTRQGHSPSLQVTVDPSKIPAGQTVSGTVHFEPLIGGGSAHTLTVTGINNYNVPTPTPTVPVTPVPNRPYEIVIPGLAAQP